MNEEAKEMHVNILNFSTYKLTRQSQRFTLDVLSPLNNLKMPFFFFVLWRVGAANVRGKSCYTSPSHRLLGTYLAPIVCLPSAAPDKLALSLPSLIHITS
jgi:hypothetical protein